MTKAETEIRALVYWQSLCYAYAVHDRLARGTGFFIRVIRPTYRNPKLWRIDMARKKEVADDTSIGS